MTAITPTSLQPPGHSEKTDRVGIWASSICAVHCLLTPVILIVAADFAGIWAHPAAHWVLAAITIPLAAGVIFKGYKRHQKKWVASCASLGILFIFASLLAPALTPAEAVAAATCENGCCPSLRQGADGSAEFNFPLASILSTLGGLLLIAAHTGNIFSNRCHLDGSSDCPCELT
ncbi:MerC domain-containing protein [Porticoccus sp. W117]|uniref:MerC domain-containing protein n=1 Tax=Porticoccus sp. W117 TaxID=3054777 RepID=UPI0025976552|nr:MerC domain-containing protein [Porticoccus sp. W117]MDM3870010.1 MerC domain-containing protein [Porticoccus sp. W117]